VVRAVGEERGGSIQGVRINPDFAAEIISQRRQQSIPETLSGVYKITKVDPSVSDGFRVTFSNIETGEEISASLQDALVSESHREKIRDAEWSKQPVRVSFRVRRLRSRYIDAVVTDVQDIPGSTKTAG
jgi:hypothetical protein